MTCAHRSTEKTVTHDMPAARGGCPCPSLHGRQAPC